MIYHAYKPIFKTIATKGKFGYNKKVSYSGAYYQKVYLLVGWNEKKKKVNLNLSPTLFNSMRKFQLFNREFRVKNYELCFVSVSCFGCSSGSIRLSQWPEWD